MNKYKENLREPPCKKWKDNKQEDTSCMDDEEVTTLVKSLQKFAQTSFNDFDRQQNQFISTITDRIIERRRTIEEVKTTVDRASQVPLSQDAPGPSEA